MPRRILFIVNPAAAGAKRWPALFRLIHGEEANCNQIITTKPGEAAWLAQKFASQYDVIAAVGGDGTVSEVVNGIQLSKVSQCALAIVPTGTGNDAAASLGLDKETPLQRLLVAVKTQSIDLIEIKCQRNGKPTLQYALLFAAVGIVSESLRLTTPVVKRLFGRRLAYPVGVACALWRYKAPYMRITVGERILEGHFLFAGAHNTPYAGGGMKIAPGAQLDDGLLNVNLIEKMGPWAALKQLRSLRDGLHINRSYVRYLAAEKLSISADSPLEIAVDGELAGHTPAQFCVKPKALQVLVP
jgi:YegS/Rv2252/BmrU family lipid kinase